MPKRVQKPRAPFRRKAEQVHEDSRTQRVRERGAAEMAALDEILDEIDQIIEENREALENYEQMGGQ